ncbi:dihydrofolate reductase family protein [Iamia majanohamensis]|uniref:Dihydrofolate reductase family protein n=1 Tax=Iamia majanohamensis TaxID=467976 RepID=A0AAF0BW96_9ACTN|nr:dihydrofolate reductase family protein [Iamia majanohamensis]WCO67570.1 dihydrofolate reductase family protein [Iamia majanohamensis]
MAPTRVADISMSLDGYVTGPAPGPAAGLGEGGEPLHTWAMASDDATDAEVLASATEATGAVVMGRRLFDVVDGPQGWDDEVGYGAAHAATPPVVVVTHDPPSTWRLGDRITFAPDGVAAALDQAEARMGDGDGEVVVMGGGEVVRQAVEHGLVAQLRIHLAPIVLGGGTSLFPAGTARRALLPVEVRPTPHATHITYELR